MKPVLFFTSGALSCRSKQSFARSSGGTPCLLPALLAVFSCSLPTSNGATLQTTSIGVGLFRDPVWQNSGSFSFNEPYARLVSASYRFFGGATVNSTVTNTTTFNNLYTIRGSAGFVLERNGQRIDSLTVPLSGSNIISAGRSGQLAATDSRTNNGTLSLENSSGVFTIKSLGGSGSNLQSNGSFNITYTYDPIGDTYDDPIEPTVSLGGIDTFSKIPSGRWFELASGTPQLIESTSGETFRQFAASIMTPGGAYRLTADGVDLGLVNSGQAVNLPQGTTQIGISEITGSVVSAMLVSNAPTYTIQVVPEPSSLALLCAGSALAFSRRRRNSREQDC